jgi:hypothetical protein
MQEIFKDIDGYEDYQVSNLGRVKSLSRYIKHFRGGKRLLKERILKPRLTHNTGDGYYMVYLYNGKGKNHLVHKLVARAFLNHIPSGKEYVIDHKDFDRTNNHLSNLKIITQRENTNRKHLKHSSKYTGVSFYKINSKWRASIGINGMQKHLGYFMEELEASKAYELAVKNIT